MPKHGGDQGGRPKGSEILVDIEEMKKWARAGCTLKEMAQKLGVSWPTLMNRLERDEYREAMEIARAEMIISLRSTQVKKALEGNIPMLIWLGKQYLGQRDQFMHTGSGPDGQIELDVTHVSALDRIKAELERFHGGAVSGAPLALAEQDSEDDPGA